MKKFRAQTILVLEYKKKDDQKSMCKIFHSSTKLIVNDPDFDKIFLLCQSVISKIKISLVKIGLLKHLWNMVIRFLSVNTDGNNSIEKQR